jgi:glutamate/tyrosine decarboxylase-like PLP-dependent enzyme
MDPLLHDVAERASRYLEGAAERSVAPEPDAVARLRALAAEPLTLDGSPDADVIALLDEVAGPATVVTNGPRFFGFVNGAALPASVAASWLVSVWDQNAFLFAMAPAATELEASAIDGVVSLLGLPPGTGGAFVTGATQANLCGLAAARHALLARKG